MASLTENAVRRLGGWGFEGCSFPPSEQLLAWLQQRLGPAGPALTSRQSFAEPAPPRALPELPVAVSTDPGDRLFHARGQGLPDLIRIRADRVAALPDGVCRPETGDEVAAIVDCCARHEVLVVPWGGGTSVTGGVNIVPGEQPVLSLDLSRLAGLRRLDQVSGLATFAAGTSGPGVEQALQANGLTLGHFPQSWELATVGGWVVTRSSGQESLGYGRIEDMVAGLELVAPAGRLSLPTLPASAAGPDLRQLVLGSEGRLGVVTEVTLRVRPQPARRQVQAALLPDLEHGVAAARELTQAGVPLAMLRLSDGPETQVAMTVGLASSSAAGLVRRYLRLRGIGPDACLMLLGAVGEPETVRSTLRSAGRVLRHHRAVSLGASPGRHWQRDRFRHPYLRDGLLDAGYATDTLETAVPWATVPTAYQVVRTAIAGSLEQVNERVAVLCHLSHPYRDGASLYFTLFLRNAADADETVSRWAMAKRAANEALVSCGATISHHHGVGQWHAPWLQAETGAVGHELLCTVARQLDPAGVLNRHVLLTTEDRLEL